MKPANPPSFLDNLLKDTPDALSILRQRGIQVLNLAQNKRSNASDIGAIIMSDHPMMANVLKIAHSLPIIRARLSKPQQPLPPSSALT